MKLLKDLPPSPYEILDPDVRWFPANELLRETSMEKLMPPLVDRLRREVKKFRDKGYAGASATSQSLLNWWFRHPDLAVRSNELEVGFRYYFSQREAIETIIFLYDVVSAKDKFDLMRFDGSGAISASMFVEDWRRYVVKMATGSGKTKVMSLALAWSFFHKAYEEDSELARNFLIIAPNIIVLDRLRKDFEGLRIFADDPVLPENGYDGRSWRDDFRLTVHLQDDIRVMEPTGNVFLTNIHRVYSGRENMPSADDENTMDYFLGKRPSGETTDSSVDLNMIVREIDELMILNDEAHHIHDERLAWFKSIQDIHHHLLQKDSSLSLQIDVTATPKRSNGAIFVQTISDYPLVEAIWQDVVKHPVVPDEASRAKLEERQSSKYTEKYAEFIHLGVVEWRRCYEVHKKVDKTAILFVMTDDTRNCDEVAKYLETTYPDLEGAVLVIHTKNNGEISESSNARAREELERLREEANSIDTSGKYKAIVSVLMLKEGWDVRNVTTIVGLRAYSARSNILPEQTLGRGLRKMYTKDVREHVSVIGTPAFMDFVHSIQTEGVELEQRKMGENSQANTPLVIEVDRDNEKKDLDALDIEIPVLAPRNYREYKNLSDLDVASILDRKTPYLHYSMEEQRKITFEDIATGVIDHTIILNDIGQIDYSSVIGYFAHVILKSLRLVGGYDILYGKIKLFVQTELFTEKVELEDPNTLRNLSEPAVTKAVIDGFIKSINELTVRERDEARIRSTIRLSKTRPFVVKYQVYLTPSKCVFNRIVGDRTLELRFANFLEQCGDVISFTKNYLAIHFKLDYIRGDGNISNYYPDFIVKLNDHRVFVVETKGMVDEDTPLKINSLKRWCEDVNQIQKEKFFDFVFVDQDGFEKYRPKNFKQLVDGFRRFKS